MSLPTTPATALRDPRRQRRQGDRWLLRRRRPMASPPPQRRQGHRGRIARSRSEVTGTSDRDPAERRQGRATPVCDGGCNVISGAGVERDRPRRRRRRRRGPGDGHHDRRQLHRSRRDRHRRRSRTSAIGVHVGQAVGTLIGGPQGQRSQSFRRWRARRLRRSGRSQPGRPRQLDRRRRRRQEAWPAPDAGILVNSEGLPGPAAEAAIAGNEIRMEGGVAISQHGFGGWISGNQIARAPTSASRASGEVEGHGNLIEGNLIEGSATNGILIESDLTKSSATKSSAAAAPGSGSLARPCPPQFGVNGNLVGGDVEAEENLVAGSGGPAIEISNPEKAANEVGRNRGFANAGLFIDLDYVAFPGDQKQGANEGIEPPTFFGDHGHRSLWRRCRARGSDPRLPQGQRRSRRARVLPRRSDRRRGGRMGSRLRGADLPPGRSSPRRRPARSAVPRSWS